MQTREKAKKIDWPWGPAYQVDLHGSEFRLHYSFIGEALSSAYYVRVAPIDGPFSMEGMRITCDKILGTLTEKYGKPTYAYRGDQTSALIDLMVGGGTKGIRPVPMDFESWVKIPELVNPDSDPLSQQNQSRRFAYRWAAGRTDIDLSFALRLGLLPSSKKDSERFVVECNVSFGGNLEIVGELMQRAEDAEKQGARDAL